MGKNKKGKTNQGSLKKKAIFLARILAVTVVATVLFLFIQYLQNRSGYDNVIPLDEEDVTDETKEFPVSELDQDSYYKDDFGFRSYDDGTVKSKRGIDVSEHQGSIDWAKVKESGVEFAFIRLGYRTYDNGNIKEDAYFEENMNGAAANGIEVGVYFFSQATTPDEAVEEAKFVIKKLKGYKIDLPIAFDMEEVTSFFDRIHGLHRDEVTEITEAFCKELDKKGYESIIYTNPSWTHKKLDLTQLTHRKLWLANYTDVTTFPYRYEIWQYTENGIIEGIAGHADLNIMYIRKE